tara:strand:+ start:1975 stop:3039 length:1065 start_codon:yes stop_codon:yes gene_type:complete
VDDNNEYLHKIGGPTQSTLSSLVYIVGTARGGTTLFQRMVGIHQQVLTFPGPTHFMSQVWPYRKKVHDRLFVQIFRMPTFYDEDAAVRTIYPDGSERLNELRRLINQRLRGRHLRLMWQLYPLIYSLTNKKIKPPHSLKCWVDKTTSSSNLNSIARYFPTAKFIFIIRDPRSAVTSLAKRATAMSRYSDSALIDKGKLIESSIHWRYTMQKILYFYRNHPTSCLKVYYEDLLVNPTTNLNNVFRFIEINTLSEPTIQNKISQLPFKRSNDYSIGPTGLGLKSDTTDSWKAQLSHVELDLIKTITGKTARKLGYEIGGPNTKLTTFSILEQLSGSKTKVVVLLKLIFLSVFELLV